MLWINSATNWNGWRSGGINELPFEEFDTTISIGLEGILVDERTTSSVIVEEGKEVEEESKEEFKSKEEFEEEVERSWNSLFVDFSENFLEVK